MVKATYYGHSTMAIKGKGAELLFDPFITPNKRASHIDVDQLRPDYIFLSHCHGDHVADFSTIQKQSGAKVVAVVETGDWVGKQGVSQDKITAMNVGGTIATSFGKAKMVSALHTNSTPTGEYAGVPVGYVLEFEGKRIYFAGDTALSMEMQLLAGEPLDWAFLPIGGFYTMDTDDAIKAARFIQCKHIIGIHYNTFPVIEIDEEAAIHQFAAAGIALHLLKIGESITL